MPSFGVDPENGTLTKCKAKPENRGKGSCFHGEHVELDGALGEPALIQRYNEEKLAEVYGACPGGARRAPAITASGVSATSGGRTLTPREFDQATQGISQAFPQGSWELLNQFYSNFDTIIRDDSVHKRTADVTRARIAAYLDSDDPVAVNVREYLGPEISTATFSAILVNEIRGMTAKVGFRSGKNRDSTRRVVLTSVANDMTKQRYVASVLFFGGRCCYCKEVLSKGPGEGQKMDPTMATGEHLTALNPGPNSSTIGATRYGNMVLACRRCNDDRGNQELEPWLKNFKAIPEKTKAESLEKIQAFRNFALYEEYTPEQRTLLNDGIAAMAKVRQEAGNDIERIRNHFKGFIYDLQGELAATGNKF